MIVRTAITTLLAMAIAVPGVGGLYYLRYGIDGRFFDALGFAVIIAPLCAIPISLIVSTQQKRLRLQAEELNRKLAYEASHDAMTGVLNRKYFLEALTQRRLDDRIDGLMLIDVDRFKRLNDTAGHHTGDEALVAMAQAIREHLGEHDIVGRVGGEEFAVLLKDSTIGKTFEIAEQIRLAVARLAFVPTDSCPFGLAVSIGVDRVRAEDTRYPLRKVDIALYEAKSGGRNRTVAFHPSMEVAPADRCAERRSNRVA